MDGYHYFVVVGADDGREPVISRLRVDETRFAHEEEHVYGETWVPSSRLSGPSRDSVHLVYPVTAEELGQLQVEQRERMACADSAYRGRRFYAVLDRGTLDDPDHLVRLWRTRSGGTAEQSYLIGQGWRDSSLRGDWGGGVDERFTLITPDRAKRIVERWSETGGAGGPSAVASEVELVLPQGEYVYHAWINCRCLPVRPAAVIRTWTSPDGHEWEESCTAGSQWSTSHLREGWHRGRVDGRFETITAEAVELFRARSTP